MDAEITVIIHFRNVCNPEDISDDVSLEDIVRRELDEEGLFGCADWPADFYITGVKEWRS